MAITKAKARSSRKGMAMRGRARGSPGLPGRSRITSGARAAGKAYQRVALGLMQATMGLAEKKGEAKGDA
jgi:hypothetical protein